MDASVRKNTILQSIKAGVLSFVFACIGVLLLALIAKLCNIGGKAWPIIKISDRSGTVLAVVFYAVRYYGRSV